MTNVTPYQVHDLGKINLDDLVVKFRNYIKNNTDKFECTNREGWENFDFDYLVFILSYEDPNVVIEMAKELEISFLVLYGIQHISHTPEFKAYLKSGRYINGELEIIPVVYGRGNETIVAIDRIEEFKGENFDFAVY